MRKWMASPKTVLETRFGKVRVTFVRSTALYAEPGDESGKSHINDRRPALVYRNEEYIGSMWFDVDGGKVSDKDSSLSRRATWTDAPRTYAAAMMQATREAIQEFVDAYPEVLVEADRADINNDLIGAESARVERAAALAATEAEIATLEKRLAAL